MTNPQIIERLKTACAAIDEKAAAEIRSNTWGNDPFAAHLSLRSAARDAMLSVVRAFSTAFATPYEEYQFLRTFGTPSKAKAAFVEMHPHCAEKEAA